MEEYGSTTYGERMAAVYDNHVARIGRASEATTAADFLADLAPAGRVLELGIGTGRIAIPLVERGIAVDGIDASEAMVAQLHAKPGGSDVTVAIGEMADVAAPARGYDLAFVVFNTFFAMLTQREQVRAFQGVAEVLRPGGRFVIEAFVPDVTRYNRGTSTMPVTIDLDEVYLDVSTYDPLTQRVDASHIRLAAGQPVELWPVRLRFAWPSELDLMAELAGLTLEARYGGFDRAPLTAASATHVSVWSKPI